MLNCTLINSSGDGPFKKVALISEETFELRRYKNSIFASTDKALCRVSIKDKYDYEIYATGARVRTFLPIDDSFWLATLVYPNEREKSNLYKSTNKGKSWQIFNNGYGEGHIINGNTIKLFPDKMEITHSTPQKIYARTTPILNVGRSSDLAQSWESVYHSWEDPFLGNGAFVYINEYDENIVWAGGATTFFSPDLKYSIDSGENWVS